MSIRLRSIHNTKIKTKLVLLGAVGIIGVTSLGVFSILSTRKINQASTDISEVWLPSIVLVEDLNKSISDYRNREYNYIVTRDEEIRLTMKQAMRNLREQIDTSFAAYTQYVMDETDHAILMETKELWDKYLRYSDSLMQISKDKRSEQAMEMITSESRALFEEVNELFSQAIDYNKKGAEKASLEADQLYEELTRFKIVIMVSVTIIVIWLVIFIIKAVERPIEDIVEGTRKVANGDLDVHLDYHSEDEIGVLTNSINLLIRRLKDIINDEKFLFQEIGSKNFEVKSSCQQAYRGDFAPILYEIESLKSRLALLAEREKKKAAKGLQKKDGDVNGDNKMDASDEKG